MTAGRQWCAVLNQKGIVLGRIRRGHLDEHPDAVARDVMEPGPSTYRPSLPATELIEAMEKGGFETAFVTDSEGRWMGLITRQDLEVAVSRGG